MLKFVAFVCALAVLFVVAHAEEADDLSGPELQRVAVYISERSTRLQQSYCNSKVLELATSC